MDVTPPVERLGQLTIFRACTRDELWEIDALATWVRVEPGRILCREESFGREFVVISAGSATVSREGRVLRRLTAGQGFGEMALLNRSTRSATVVADEPTELLVFNPAEFTRLLDVAPRVARELLVEANGRLRQAEANGRPRHVGANGRSRQRGASISVMAHPTTAAIRFAAAR
jgi:CRP-like cAMP-binding protein